jgi:hypothetical protein
MKDLTSQVATILSFITSIIQLIVIVIVINAFSAQTKYAERQYLILEKIIEKQQEISNSSKEQLIRIDNMVRAFTQPAQ